MNKAAEDIIRAGTSKNTLRAYAGDEKYFWRWARLATKCRKGYPVPAKIVLKFATDHLLGMDPKVEKKMISKGIKENPARTPCLPWSAGFQA